MTICDLADLVGIVPYLVGFPPKESLVVVVTDNAQVRLTGRIDLADVVDGGVSAFLSRITDRFPRADFWFLVYTSEDVSGWEVLAQCAQSVESDQLGRLIWVNAMGWIADDPNGVRGSHETAAAASRAAMLGLPIADSREQLAHRLKGPADELIDHLLEQFDRAVACVEGWSCEERLTRLADLTGHAQTEFERVVLAVLATDPIMQRAVIGYWDRTSVDQAVDLWGRVVDVSLTPWMGGPIGLLGLAAWLGSQGALHTICLERLDRLGSADVLSGVLGWINHDVVPPESWVHTKSAVLAAFDAHIADTEARRD